MSAAFHNEAWQSSSEPSYDCTLSVRVTMSVGLVHEPPRARDTVGAITFRGGLGAGGGDGLGPGDADGPGGGPGGASMAV
jgi:hypothetical protein